MKETGKWKAKKRKDPMEREGSAKSEKEESGQKGM